MNKKKIITLIFIPIFIALFLVGCSEASRVNHNISNQAEYFQCERRLTVYNARTDLIIMTVEGYMNISNNNILWLPDYTHSWTDEMLYEYFGLTDSEIQEIEKCILIK